MILILKIVLGILAALFMIACFAALIIGVHCLSWFYWRPCKHCGHTLKYKGLKGDGDSSHYLFHCLICDSWESVPHDEFLSSIDKGFNPNQQTS